MSNLYPHVSLPGRSEIGGIVSAWKNTGIENEPGRRDVTYTIAGRLVGKRESGGITFLDVRDWSGEMQVVCRYNPQEVGAADRAVDLKVGDIISAYGHLYITKRKREVTIEASRVGLLSKSLKPPPDRHVGLLDAGTRARHRELDLIGNEETRRVFDGRARIIAAVRRWLALRHFVEVETPILQSLPGGANVRPFSTHHNALDRDLYLRISVELFVNRCVAGGMDRVYDMGKVFRNEGISPKHSPEFTVIEWFMSYLNYRDIADETEDMIAFVAQEAMGRSTFTCGGQTIDFSQPWDRITMRNLIGEVLGVDIDKLPEPGWAGQVMDLYASIESDLVQPTIVFDFPLEPFPITKRHADDFRLGEHFDGVIGGVEIASGDTELNDPGEQRHRFALQRELRGGEGHVTDADEEYVEALECGMPPTSGVGMGIDRLCMILLEKDNLRDVIPFPIVRSQ